MELLVWGFVVPSLGFKLGFHHNPRFLERWVGKTLVGAR